MLSMYCTYIGYRNSCGWITTRPMCARWERASYVMKHDIHMLWISVTPPGPRAPRTRIKLLNICHLSETCSMLRRCGRQFSDFQLPTWYDASCGVSHILLTLNHLCRFRIKPRFYEYLIHGAVTAVRAIWNTFNNSYN